MTSTTKVPYVNLSAQHEPIKAELLDSISRVLDHGRFILGKEVEEFERRFAEICEVDYAIGVNSGTDALVLALKALGIGQGDEVITPANSFLASTSCIALVGANPVLVDSQDDYNIDPLRIEQAITPRTRAIIPVHLTGRPAEMQKIMDIAERHGLHVIEDCAQAVGASYKGQVVGSFGTAGCFSLHPLKTLNAIGDGGVLVTNDEALSKQFKLMRNHGLSNRDDCIAWGFNSRLDTLQAAVLLVKLNYLDEWTERRRSNAQFYQRNLAGVNQVQIPMDEPYERAVYHTFVIQAPRRDELQRYLAAKGIGTAIAYPTPIHLQRAAIGLGYGAGSFPVTEGQAQRILSLPVYGELKQHQLEYVVECVQNFYKEAS